jgi:hypothetical protein
VHSNVCVCVCPYQLRMNHYDMVTVFYSLYRATQQAEEEGAAAAAAIERSDKNSSEAQRALFNASFLKTNSREYFIKMP